MKLQKKHKKLLHEPKRLCYNVIMLKTKTKVTTGIVGLALIFSAVAVNILSSDQSHAACSSSPCNTTFQVNVQDTLAVTITTDYSDGTGNTGSFLRNKISLSVSTNSSNGFAASMYPQNYSTDNAPLVNTVDSSKTLPTWTGTTYYSCGGTSACSNFPVNKWGYSLNDTSSYAGTYYAMTGTSASPTTVLTSSGTSGSKDIYFGAKIDSTQAAGTYEGKVVISVVSGTTTPSTPSNPATPSDDTSGDTTATYDTTNNRTVYTTVSSTDSTTTTTTEVSTGDNRSVYSYAAPQGESKTTESNIASTSQLATGLAVASATAATSGLIFFILAKRREDDEDEEEGLEG